MENCYSNNANEQLSTQYVTFRVADLYFGVDVSNAKEIIKHQVMTPVPLAAHFVKGLINLRGQIITAIDLRALMHLQPLQQDQQPMNVVVHTEGEIVSILVDSVGDVIDVEHSWYEPTPSTLSKHIKNCVKGVFKLKSELLLVLDTLSCIQATNIEDLN